MSSSHVSTCAFRAALLSLALVSTRAEAAQARATAATTEDATTREARDQGPFGPLRIGAFGGIGVPRALSIEGMIKIDDLVGIGLEYSVLPKLSVSGVDAKLNAVNADLRIFPMRNGFFVGVAVGHQRLDVTSTLTLPYSLGAVAEAVSADTWFINPRIGFLWTWDPGLTLGIDAGAQIPISATFTNTIPSELAVSQTATDVSHAIGKDVLPTVNLLRLGLMF